MALPQPSCSPEYVRRITPRAPRGGTLADGDVVVFRKAGVLYGVCQVTGDFTDGPGIFKLVPLPEGAKTADPLAQLLVVRQGPWVGFKSAAAGNCFLQARRRGPDHLCFYNTNWGTWEQWEIAGDEPEGGWAKWTFRFKSRRLENFVFAVEVERLDQSSVSASVAQGQVQRKVQSVQENVDEKQGNVLRAMSSLLTSEWRHFMQREIQARRALQAELSALRQELLDVRDGAVSEIGKLSEDAEATVSYLMDHIAAREEQIRQLDESFAATCTERSAHQERLAEALGQKRERSRLRGAYDRWLEASLRNRRLRVLERQFQDRQRFRLARRVFGVWEQVWRRRARLEAAVRERVKALIMVRGFQAWQQWAEEKKAVKRMVKEGKRRNANGLARRVLVQWQGLVETEKEKGDLLERLFDSWQTRLAGRAVVKWKEYVVMKQQKRMFEGQLQRSSHLRAARASFRAWRKRVEVKKEGRRLEQRLERAFQRRRLAFAFNALREEVRFIADQEGKAAAVHKDRLAARLAAVFEAWRDVVIDRRLRETLAEGLQERVEARLLSRGFEAWSLYVEERRQSLLEVARLEGIKRERRLRRGFEVWRQETEARKGQQKVAAFLARQGEKSMLAVILDGWKDFVRTKKEARDLEAGLDRRWQARCALLAFESWREYAGEKARRRAGFRRAAAFADRRLLARTVLAWSDAVNHRREKRKMVQAVEKVVSKGLLRRAFLEWREATEQAKEETEAEIREEERQWRRAESWARKRVLQEGFRVWSDFVAEAQAKRLEESHCAIEELLKEERAAAWAKRQFLEAVFAAWRCEVLEVLEERRAAEEKERERKVEEEREDARKEALADRWAVKRRLERGFRVWREEAEGASIDWLAARIAESEDQKEMERVEARRADFADRWAKRRLQEKVFGAWSLALEEARDEAENEARKQEEERAKEKRAEGWATRRLLERVWRLWQDAVSDAQQKALEEDERKAREAEVEGIREARAELWAKRRLEQRAFWSWAASVEDAKEDREVLREEESRREQQEREQEEEDERRAARWARKRRVEATFKGWLEAVVQSREEEEVAQKELEAAKIEAARQEEQEVRAASWAARRLMETAFLAWQEVVHVAREERTREEERRLRAEVWAKRRMIERGFLAWKTGVEACAEERLAEQAEEERRLAGQVEMDQRVMRRVMLAWQDSAAAARVLRVGEELARKELMVKVFGEWFRVAHLSLASRQAACMEITKRRQLSLQRRVFDSWQDALWLSKAAHERTEQLWKRKAQRLVTAVFVLWREWASSRVVQKRRLGALCKVRESRLMAATLRAWCQLAAERQATRLTGQRLMARVQRRRLKEAFSAWEAFVEEKVQTRGELGACITRKKMAKRWFMQWYWDAFDNEIHRSLVDIVSSTQLSINEAERAPLSGGTNGTLQRNGERSSADDWRALMNHGLGAKGLQRPGTFAMGGLGLRDRALVERKERNGDSFGGQSGTTDGIPVRGLASGSGVLLGREGANGNAIGGRGECNETDRSLIRNSGFLNGALVERKEGHGNAVGGQSGTINGSVTRSSGILNGGWKEGDANGMDRYSGLSNKHLDLLSRIPAPARATGALATGAAAGPQVRTYFGPVGKSEIQEGLIFGQGRSRQLPPIASKLGTGQREEGGVKADSLGRWDYLQREKLLRGPLGRKASEETEESREFTEAVVKELVRSEDGRIATLSGSYDLRAHVRRSLDLGHGLRSADVEATRPHSSSGNEERHGGSQRSAFESLLNRSESI